MNVLPRRIRVLHVVDSLRLGGMERMAVEFANLLDPSAFDVALCATREGGPLAEQLVDAVQLTILDRRARWDVTGIAKLAQLVRSKQIDVVHTHGRGTAKLVSLCRGTGLISSRHVFHDHFGDLECDDHVDGGLRLATKVGVDQYIGVSQALCEWAVDGLRMPRERVALVRNGIDVQRFDRETRHPIATPQEAARSEVVVAMVAGLREMKDHPTVLRALAGSEHRKQVKLMLIGRSYDDAYSRRCHAMIEDLGLSPQVELVGASNDVPALLAASDIGILSSASESGPLALLEYMAAGLPYVVTETGELARAVKELGSGFVVPARDSVALGATLDRLLAMAPAERRAMGARGRTAVVERFDQRRAVKDVAAVYRTLVGR